MIRVYLHFFLLARTTICATPKYFSKVEVSGSTNVGVYRPAGAEGSVPIEECPSKCEFRCSATSHKKPRLFFCNYCCQKCLCVPSGTSGNKEGCPCYNDMKTNLENVIGSHACTI